MFTRIPQVRQPAISCDMRSRRRVKRIIVRAERCSGCRACQVACVARHEGVFRHEHGAPPRGQGRGRRGWMSRTPAGCAAARPAWRHAPQGRLHKDEASGAILLHEEQCIGCSACVDACPFGDAAVAPRDGTGRRSATCAAATPLASSVAPRAPLPTASERLEMRGEARDGAVSDVRL